MQTTIKRTQLLSILQKNHDTHRKVFLEACESYREQVIKELESMLEEAKKARGSGELCL